MDAQEKYILSIKHLPTHMHILACQIILSSGQAAFFFFFFLKLVAMAAVKEKWPSLGRSYRRL